MRALALLFVGCALVACGGTTSTGVPGGGGSSSGTTTSSSSGSSETGGSCGAASCSASQYCAVAVGACATASASGTCKPRPQACDKIYSPVCGCDGKTYGNDCEAFSNGVSVAKTGECGTTTPGSGCGTRGAPPCAADEWCAYPADAQCGATDKPGTCTKKPTEPVACITLYDPVCGCDGKTYGNDCEAHAAMTSVMSKGECSK